MESGCPRSLQVATFPRCRHPDCIAVRLPPQSPSRYILPDVRSDPGQRPVAPAVSKSLHSTIRRARSISQSGCPRSLQVATFDGIGMVPQLAVRLPPQSPSRYIRRRGSPPCGGRPVAPAVSKSLHSPSVTASPWPSSGCPRSLQVATFDAMESTALVSVRLPPQSPSRYIRGAQHAPCIPGPVAPAVSKSLHSGGRSMSIEELSGCPRSLQVATFRQAGMPQRAIVRLPPQSPSRYIRAAGGARRCSRPVAPAVSKSLHSLWNSSWVRMRSGCPRSLQVATFPPPRAPSAASCPVAPAVSKSLHSRRSTSTTSRPSGCPRSLQVATFQTRLMDMYVKVRLPPQSPSRYIRLRGSPRPPPGPVAPAVSKSLHSRRIRWSRRALSGCPRSLQVATFLCA